MTGSSKVLCAVVVWAFAASSALADRLVEDFDATPGGGFNNPAFVHDIVRDEIVGTVGPNWEFTSSWSVSPLYSLYLAPGADFITFDLPEGQYVDYAEAWLAGDALLPAFFHVLGVDDAGDPLDVWYSSQGLGSLVFVSTEGDGFARIDEIRLTAMKNGAFDDVAINVVPEPATLAFLAVGFAGLVSRRSLRKRRTLRS